MLSLCSQYCLAQSANDKKDEPVFDHYLGAQVGQLIMHLFNSNANSIGTGNPYLVTYSMNNHKTGWGIRFGAGLNATANSTAGASSLTTTDNTDFQFRAGIEKVIEIAPKWTAGTGFDLIINSQNDNNTVNNFNQYDTTLTTTKTKVLSFGGGVFGKINYHLGKRILIGTEGSLYYTTGTKNQTVDVTTTYSVNPSTFTESKTRPGIHQGNFNLPIVVYLILKF